MALEHFIGDFGEAEATRYMKETFGCDVVLVVENASKNGIDIIGVKKYGRGGKRKDTIFEIEVKTTTTKGGGRLSMSQKKAYLNAGTILMEAAAGTGRFSAASSSMQRKARYILAVFANGAPLIPVAVVINIDKASAQHGYTIKSAAAVKIKRVRAYNFSKTHGIPVRKMVYDSGWTSP